MNAKVGDRISLDAKKVGQARRTGNVRALVEGLSGVRYEVEWDDGSVSVISPGGGVLLVEGRSGKGAGKAAKGKPGAKKAAAQKKDKKKKASAKRTKGR
jgi:hypothetical protein